MIFSLQGIWEQAITGGFISGLTLLPNQTWVCLHVYNNANLQIWGCVKERTAFIARHPKWGQARMTAYTQKTQDPQSLSGKGF